MLATASFDVDDAVRNVCMVPRTCLNGANVLVVKSTVSIVDVLFGVVVPVVEVVGVQLRAFLDDFDNRRLAAPSSRRVNDASPTALDTDLRLLLASTMAV